MIYENYFTFPHDFCLHSYSRSMSYTPSILPQNWQQPNGNTGNSIAITKMRSENWKKEENNKTGTHNLISFTFHQTDYLRPPNFSAFPFLAFAVCVCHVRIICCRHFSRPGTVSNDATWFTLPQKSFGYTFPFVNKRFLSFPFQIWYWPIARRDRG